MVRDTEYAYAVGRIRALEKSLIDRNHIERMIDAETAGEAFDILRDSVYGQWISDVKNPFEYEAAIGSVLRDTYRILESILPEPEVFKPFLIRHDFHNAKVLIKSMFLDTDADALLTDAGSIPVDVLKKAVGEKNYKEIPDYMAKAVSEAIEAFNTTHSPQRIDVILDRAMFSAMSDMAQSTGYEFIVRLVELQIDLYNIKTLIRLRKRKDRHKYDAKVFIEKGKLPPDVFAQLMDRQDEDLANFLKKEGYGRLVPAQDFGWPEFEKNEDDTVMRFIKDKKRVNLGIEPVIGYLLARENEAKVVRIIMVGKINGVKPENIKARIRELYV